MTIGSELTSNAQGTGGNVRDSQGDRDAASAVRHDTTSARGNGALQKKDGLIDVDGGDDEPTLQDGAIPATTDGDDLGGHNALLKALRDNKAEEQRLMRKANAFIKLAHEPLIKLFPKIAQLPGVVDFVLASAKTMTPKNKAALNFYVGYVLKARIDKSGEKGN